VEVVPENDCAGEGPAAFLNYRPIFSSERMLHKDYGSKYSVEKELLVVILKGLVAKTNRLAVNRQLTLTL
jgi:hypothetical protein